MNKLNILIVLILILRSYVILAQNSFEKSYKVNSFDKETGVGAVECIGKGFLISTYSDDCNFCTSYQGLICLNEFGDTVWTKHYSHGTAYEGTGPLINYDNGYILGDNFTSFHSIATNLAMSFNRIDSLGNLLWQTIIEDTIKDLVCTNLFFEPNGNILAGYYDSRNGGNFTLKIDSSGNIIWNKKICDLPRYGHFTTAIVDSNYFYYFIGGCTWNNLPATYLLKVDSAGDTLRSTFYPNDTIFGRTLVSGDNNSIYIAGQRKDSLNQIQFGIVKIDLSGAYIWGRTLNSNYQNYPNSMTKTFDHGFVVTGIRNDGTPNGRLILMKADQSGNKLWEKIFCLNSCFLSDGNSILETKDSMLLITGQIQKFQSIPNVYVIKTDSIGDIVNQIGIINNDDRELQILPNPGNGIFQIDDSELLLTGFIYDSVGKVVEEISNSNEINLLNFQTGLYYYELTDSQNKIFRGKIILI